MSSPTQPTTPRRGGTAPQQQPRSAAKGTASKRPSRAAAACPRPLGWRPPSGWRQVLALRQPDKVLEHLLDGDPLAIRSLVAEVLRGRALLLDADRLHLRLIARLAHDVAIDGPPSESASIVEHLELAIADLLIEERTQVTAPSSAAVTPGTDPEPGQSGPSPFKALAEPLGLDPIQLRRACDAFNRRPDAERLAFFGLFVERRELDQVAGDRGQSATEVARQARSALRAALAATAVNESAQSEDKLA